MFTAANKGSYIAQAGQTNPYVNAFNVANAYSFDAFDLAQSAMKADTAKYISKKENEAKKDYYKTMGKAGQKGLAQVESAREVAQGQQRMAGMLGTLGALSYGTSRYFQDKNNRPPAPEKRQSADMSGVMEGYESQIEALEANQTAIDNLKNTVGKLTELTQTKPAGSVDTPTDSSTSATGGVKPIQPSTTQASFNFENFDDLDNKAFGIISKYEAGSYGFDAVNQGGSKGGHEIPRGFYSGKFSGMKQHGGRKLTDLTLGEVMELQRDPGRSKMSDSEWVSSGKLHAAGAYQFIGDTLKDEVTKMGLDLNSKFTPQLQAQIAKSHATRLGGISPSTWIGLKNMTPEERQIISQWNSRL